ncbi:MAG: hypothetical protein FJZ59_07835 [Chlamydiae bacterium]|nr:hypothetical protein [Chlamydiota bacterium]
MNLNKELGSVAEAVKKVMEAELSSKQKQIAKMAEPKHKIDAGDLAKLRAGHKPVKEEAEQIEELKKSTLGSYVKKASKDLANQSFDHGEDEHRQYGDPEDTEREDEMKKRERDIENRQKGINRAAKKLSKEEIEQEEKSFMTFSEMLAAYKEYGLAVIAEEPTQDEYEKEVDKAKDKSQGKEKAEVAKPLVQAVKQEETHKQVEVIDMTDPNEIKVSTIDLDERSMTKPEMEKREDIVKGMKKKMSGFKERYGDRAKNVMYATATKQAMKY